MRYKKDTYTSSERVCIVCGKPFACEFVLDHDNKVIFFHKECYKKELKHEESTN